MTIATNILQIAPDISQEKPLLICYSHLRWDFVFQRPQHLLTRAARTHRVMFFEEPVFDRDCCARLSITEREGGIQVIVPHLPMGITANEAAVFQRTLLNALLMGEKPTIGWYYSPMALTFSDHIDHDICVYDCMDELTGFLGAPTELSELEARLLERADVVFAGGYALYEAKQRFHDNIHPFPSSIDAKHFNLARNRNLAEPAELEGMAHPRLCFFGVIDERFDLELLASLAAARPDWQFVMIGPVVKIDAAALPEASNIHWLGGRSYQQLPQYLAQMDIGIMPFAHNAATRFISPTKTPEFLAAGLPVVSTSIRDVVRSYGAKGLVEIADNAADFIAAVEKLIAVDRTRWLSDVDQHLKSNSWDSTWNAMLSLMRRAKPRSLVMRETVMPDAVLRLPQPWQKEGVAAVVNTI